jgi:hypothetical protein
MIQDFYVDELNDSLNVRNIYIADQSSSLSKLTFFFLFLFLNRRAKSDSYPVFSLACWGSSGGAVP